MKTNLIVHIEPETFNRLLNNQIQKNEKEGYVIRDIKFGSKGTSFIALIMSVKLTK